MINMFIFYVVLFNFEGSVGQYWNKLKEEVKIIII